MAMPPSSFPAILDSTLASSGDAGPGIGENGDVAGGIVISGERIIRHASSIAASNA